MKNIRTIISVGAILLSVCIANPMKAQDTQKEGEKPKAVPADVTAILEKSCTGCHSNDGGAMAKMHFNFTKWSEYSAEERTSIGQDIVKIVSKGKMPPKKFLKNYPDLKLTAAEKKTISNWAGQL
jgi:mono/diheme cytochrome c family protein